MHKESLFFLLEPFNRKERKNIPAGRIASDYMVVILSGVDLGALHKLIYITESIPGAIRSSFPSANRVMHFKLNVQEGKTKHRIIRREQRTPQSWRK
jgi:hypothetical protein